MQERKTGTAFKKGHSRGTRIKTLLPHVPRVQRGTWDMQRLSGLTLGDPLSLQSAILVKQCSAVGALPPLTVIFMAPLLGINERSHRPRLSTPILCWQ